MVPMPLIENMIYKLENTMSTLNRIKEDQLSARKAKNSSEATLLTTLLAESVIVGKNQGRESSEEEVMAVVKKFLKNNAQYIHDIGSTKPDLKLQLETEQTILSRYVPVQLSENELTVIVKDIITTTQTLNMGEIMKAVKASYDGKYDGKMLSSIVKSLL